MWHRFKDSAAQYVLDERDSSCNEVVGGDGVAVRAGARVDVERTTSTGGRGHRGRGERGTIPNLWKIEILAKYLTRALNPTCTCTGSARLLGRRLGCCTCKITLAKTTFAKENIGQDDSGQGEEIWFYVEIYLLATDSATTSALKLHYQFKHYCAQVRLANVAQAHMHILDLVWERTCSSLKGLTVWKWLIITYKFSDNLEFLAEELYHTKTTIKTIIPIISCQKWHLNVAPSGQVQVSGRDPLPQGLPWKHFTSICFLLNSFPISNFSCQGS